jgi:hypothetical protein
MQTMGRPLLATAIAVALFGCSKDQPPTETKATASASTNAAAAPTPTPSASATTTASASAPEPPHDCPPKSAGIGSLAKPCEAKGSERMMTVKWTKTTDETGPSFSITNKSKLVILYGKIAVYFYDKAGKQLDATPDTSENPPKVRHFHTCSGTFFQGVMKPAENAELTFSCVPKKAVPEGTVTIEAEMQSVGFADPTGTKVDFYWRNPDLAPDARPKGAK